MAEPADVPRGRPTRLVAGATVAVCALAVAGWAVLVGPLHERPAAATAEPTDLGTAAVVRTDIGERQEVTGTLGYAGALTVVAERSGILTRVATPGSTVRPGQPVAEVDGRPVLLMHGSRPAWRPFVVGMSDGPDVRQLETGLRSLGYDPSRRMAVDAHFTAATAAAVGRWQRSLSEPPTGTVGLGDVAFLPASLRVTADEAQPGAPVGPGQPLVSGTTTTHQVTVALDAARQGLVHAGDAVVVTMPDGRTTTRGVVTFVSRVASAGGQAGTDQAGAGQQGGSGGAAPTVQVTVALADQRAAGRLDQAPVQVSVTDQLHRGVLAVPVTALLGTAGGGYAVTPAGGGPNLRVSVGVFDDLTQLVEVSGRGVVAGMRVEVPQS